MRYTKPFTLLQRQKALAVYRSMRAAYERMRFDFPPLTTAQRQLLREYRELISDFARTLVNPDA